MELSLESLAKFKQLWKEEFGENLSDDEACEHFSRLLTVLKVICYPETTADLDKPEGYDTVRNAK